MKTKKILILALSCVMICMCFSGCTATNTEDESSFMKVNIRTGYFDMNNVTYWDFMTNTLFEYYDGKNCHMTDSKKTDLEFIDEEGNGRCMKMNKALSTKPKEIRIYTSLDKKTYETYNIEY